MCDARIATFCPPQKQSRCSGERVSGGIRGNLSSFFRLLTDNLGPAHFTQAVLRTVSRTLYCPRQKMNQGGQARQKVNRGGQARQTAIPPYRQRDGGQARLAVKKVPPKDKAWRMLRQSRSDAFGKRRRMEKNRKIMAGKPGDLLRQRRIRRGARGATSRRKDGNIE